LDKQEKLELAELIATAVVNTLKKEGVIGQAAQKPKSEKTAYQKTEQLLFNYIGFKRIVEERKQEIIDLRTHGVPGKSGSIVQYSPKSGTVHGTTLPEESVEAAVRSVEASVQGTIQVINLMDKCMASLKNDPYYEIIEMRYFEGRTLEDIGVYFGCDHTTISRNKNRLVRELSMRLFPDEVSKEMLQ
jgi:DNA-directed RNA polymerase specialized sigma subunit